MSREEVNHEIQALSNQAGLGGFQEWTVEEVHGHHDQLDLSIVHRNEYSWTLRHLIKFIREPYKVRQHFMRTLCELAQVKPFGYHGIRHLVAQMWYGLGKPLGFIQRYLRHQHATTTEIYLKSLGCEEIRSGLDELIFPTLDELKQAQGGLAINSVFDQLLRTNNEAIVINLDDARKSKVGGSGDGVVSGRKFEECPDTTI